MANVLIVAYLLIVLAMIGVILMQRSEGGALGIGGGPGGGLVSARGSANLLSRTTAILAALFMSIAIALTIVADLDNTNKVIVENAAQGAAEGTVLDSLNALQGDSTDNGALPVPAADSAGSNGADAGAATPAQPATDAAANGGSAANADAPNVAVPAAPAAPAGTAN